MHHQTMSITKKFVSGWVLASILLLVACNNTELLNSSNDNSDDAAFEAFYQQLSLLTSPPLISSNTNTTRNSNNDVASIPSVSNETLNKLATLKISELRTAKDSIAALLGKKCIDAYESRKINNYAYMYELLGGHSGMDQIKSFTKSYMGAPKGWEFAKTLIPTDLSADQKALYVIMAVYVDRFARPVKIHAMSHLYEFISDSKSPNTRGYRYPSVSDCNRELDDMLAAAGANMNAEEFIKIWMNQSSDNQNPENGPSDDSQYELDLYTIYLSYRMCIASSQNDDNRDNDPIDVDTIPCNSFLQY